jgi:hypothetical protein
MSLTTSIPRAGTHLAQAIEWLPFSIARSIRARNITGVPVPWHVRFRLWLADTVGFCSMIAGGVIQSFFGMVAGMVAFVLRPSQLSVLQVLSAIVAPFVLLPAQLVVLLQHIGFRQQSPRVLTATEEALLHTVFNHTLNTSQILIIERKQGWLGKIPASFVIGRVIYLKRVNPDVLVHEAVHIWQYENFGSRYITDALWAQWRYGRSGKKADAYDWRYFAQQGITNWELLNVEAQAQLIEETWQKSNIAEELKEYYPLITSAYRRIRSH